MKKRLTDAEKWTQNKWFRKLECKYKLFWLFICDSCDSVGVWEEDIELSSFLIGEKLDKETILEILKGKIRVICNGKKWWITDFCFFQYGELKEENVNNKPHQSYITLLKKHSLWIDYKKLLKDYSTKSHSLSNRLKDTDKEQDKEEAKDKDKIGFAEFVSMTQDEYDKLSVKFGVEAAGVMVEILDNAKGSKGYTYKSDYRAILSWVVEEFKKRTKTGKSKDQQIYEDANKINEEVMKNEQSEGL